MAGDRNVIIIDEEFDIQILSNGKSGRFGVVSFHLRSI